MLKERNYVTEKRKEERPVQKEGPFYSDYKTLWMLPTCCEDAVLLITEKLTQDKLTSQKSLADVGD